MIGSKIFSKKHVYNSISWAKENIETAPSGAVFLADSHDFTKGRQGRVWQFDKDQLLVTILLKPNILNKIKKDDLELRLNKLNMAICLGILGPLKKFGVGIKWPNDLVFKDKKVGGVLFELVWQNNNLQGIIFGFAINVNNTISKESDLYNIAKSLKNITCKEIDKKFLFNALIKSLNVFYQKWLNGEFDQIFNLWKADQVYLGKEIKIHKKSGCLIQGNFENLLPNGDLVLVKKGTTEIVPFYLVENINS